MFTKEEFLKSVPIFFQKNKGLFLLSAGICLGWISMMFFTYVRKPNFDMYVQKESRQTNTYKFINPLLECDQAESVGVSYYKVAFDNVQTLVDSFKSNGTATDIAVYFRDLNNGPWYSINEESLFEPASLFKLPLLVAYYKKRESDPELFNRTTKIIEEEKDKQAIQPSTYAQVGKEYTIQQLLDYMIIYSDNNSAMSLFEYLGDKYISTIFSDLGLTILIDDKSRYVVTVKNYSSIYRLLFNGSYLLKEDSEKVLELLSKTTYADGLRKAIPKEVQLAHKFGERELLSSTQSVSTYQLHDCGIVYYPKRPFLLCIMTKGSDPGKLQSVVQKIAGSIYEDFDAGIRKAQAPK